MGLKPYQYDVQGWAKMNECDSKPIIELRICTQGRGRADRAPFQGHDEKQIN